MRHSPLIRCCTLLLPAVCMLLLGGCVNTLRDRELQEVAKDWLKVMRASQVLPVYPVTEDLEPGDVFLVTTPIQDQARLYNEKGYFPLDQLATRLALPEDAYQEFYGIRYWDPTFEDVPHARPGQPETDEIVAPRVFFPTYDITVKSDGSFKAALPIQGIPVAIGLAGQGVATVSVALTDAYTYALPSTTLLGSLYEWATQPEVRDELGELASDSEEEVFLRVVNRVYLVRKVRVVATSTRDRSQDLAAEMPTLDGLVADPTKLEAYRDSIRNANEAISPEGQEGEARDTFGGSIKLSQSLSRSVTLDEDLGQPLVIGYLGYDLPIRKNGDLGPAVATLARVENRDIKISLEAGERSLEERLYKLFKHELSELEPAEQRSAAVYIARGLKQSSMERFASNDPSIQDDEAFVRMFKGELDRFVSGHDPVRYRRVFRLWETAPGGPDDKEG